MKIFIGLISSDEKICEAYRRDRTGLIPKELLNGKLKGLNPVFHVGAFNPNAADSSIEEYLKNATRTSDAGVLVIESQHRHLVDAIPNAYFSAEVEIEVGNGQYKNFFAGIFARLLKNFACAMDCMTRSDNEQVMSLPLRNFVSDDLQELARIFREESLSGSFNSEMGAQTTKLKARKSPKRNSSYRNKMFIVDDKEKHFEYGKEVHSKVATGEPHGTSCEINGNFRFGKRVASDRHYNVSRGPGDGVRIGGDFPNCHDAVITVKETTHINMFSNDHH